MAIVLNGTTGVTTPSIDTAAGNADLTTMSVAGNEISAVNSLGFRNRIINGDMRIDQRNNQSALSIVNTDPAFAVDRWSFVGASQAGQLTVARSTVTPNSSFTNSYLVTVTSADSGVSASSNNYRLQQAIEGFNTADLGWGTAGAQAVTISFWVRSSLTGTFGGSVLNSLVNRSYPFTFAVSTANTWEQKTVVIPGDTTGTWRTDNGIGILLVFSLGAGSTLTSTAGVWASKNYYGATGQTQVIATNGATFYLTGVQLEAGSVATPFERRPYGTELALCQRYYYQTQFISGSEQSYGTGFNVSTTVAEFMTPFPVPMRTRPTSLTAVAANRFEVRHGATAAIASAIAFTRSTPTQAVSRATTSGLTAGQGSMIAGHATVNQSLAWSVEL